MDKKKEKLLTEANKAYNKQKLNDFQGLKKYVVTTIFIVNVKY